MAKLEPAPTLRCSERWSDRALPVCGRLAIAERVHPDTADRTFVCGLHARPGDVPLSEPTRIRLVTVSCDLVFAGVSSAAVPAQAEAVAALELAAVTAGARLSIRFVTSTLARYYPSVLAIGTAREPGAG